MATQIGNAARAEAPKRAVKARSPNITKKKKFVAPSRPKLRCNSSRALCRSMELVSN